MRTRALLFALLAFTFGLEQSHAASSPLMACPEDSSSTGIGRRSHYHYTHSPASRRHGHHQPCLALVLSPAELWGIRVASAVSTYFGFVAVVDRPRGQLLVDPACLEMKESMVPGAGLGLFVTTTMRRGTVLGTYPGAVIPLQQNMNKLRAFPQCEGYIWRFSDNQFVIDPTNTQGNIEDFCKGGNPSMPLSVALFQTLLSFVQVPTTLCRINEPPKGRDVNVVTDEDRDARTVTFSLERDVYEGEELYIDYGLNYDRSRYGG